MKKIHRFLFSGSLASPQIVIDDAALLHQWSRVLRFQVGDHLQLCDGKGQEVEVSIVEISKRNMVLRVEARTSSVSEPARQVTLYVSILKRENMEWVVQKATEIGATSIVPLICRRTVKQDVRMDRLQDIAREAMEQSGRGRVPTIGQPLSLQDAFKSAMSNDQNLFFHTELTGSRASKHPNDSLRTIGVFVGPEGGWDDEEVMYAHQAGHEMASLGAFILRGETAAMVATYLAVHGLTLS